MDKKVNSGSGGGGSKQQTRKMPGSAGKPGIDFTDPAVISIIVALFVVLLTLLFWMKKSKSKGRCVLFVGPSDSGKTAILSHLINGQGTETVTSLIPNEYEYQVENGNSSVTLKDLPGHERVRSKFWEQHKNGLRGIVCLVDSAGGNKAVRESAEVIYSVLSDPLVKSLKPNILIFANKQDVPSAKGHNVIRPQLERELTTLRLTKSASLQSIGGSQDTKTTIGRPGKDFDFDHVSPIKVDFAEGSGNKNDPELNELEEWISKVA